MEVNLSRLKKLKYMLEHHDEIFKKDDTSKVKVDNKMYTSVGKFDLSVWFKPNCVSAACALGSAACYPPFKRMGLKLSGDSLVGTGIWFKPEYKEWTDFEAGAAFFSISLYESDWLFNPSHYEIEYENAEDDDSVLKLVTPKVVAESVDS